MIKSYNVKESLYYIIEFIRSVQMCHKLYPQMREIQSTIWANPTWNPGDQQMRRSEWIMEKHHESRWHLKHDSIEISGGFQINRLIGFNKHKWPISFDEILIWKKKKYNNSIEAQFIMNMEKRHTENEYEMAKDGLLEFYDGGLNCIGS